MADLGIDPAPEDKRAREWLAPFIRSKIAFWHPLLSGLGP
jgi:hypothetical protein